MKWSGGLGTVNVLFSVKIEAVNNIKPETKLDIVTGIRPTGNLTLANYIGAIKPIVELQQKELEMMVFIADLHAYTTHAPTTADQYAKEVSLDLLALGIDPHKTALYQQSYLFKELSQLTLILSKHISVAELLRVPTLKDKIDAKQQTETANTLLLLYPVLMAADILLVRAAKVPVGEDQLAHLEVTRKLTHRFNSTYHNIFVEPQPHTMRALRILSLKGSSKMSKSYPEGAIFLSDTPDEVAKKIMRAETAEAGEMSPNLQSLITIARNLTSSEEQRTQLKHLCQQHQQGNQVMADFKELLITIINHFLKEYQHRKLQYVDNPQELEEIINQGNQRAKILATDTMLLVEQALHQL